MHIFLSRILLVLFFAIGILVPLLFAHAQSPVPLNAPFPGQGGTGQIPGGERAITTYIEQLYRFSLILGTFLAVLMIVVGGIQYAASAGNASIKQDAKERIKSAIMGLVLLLAVVLVLRTLNPAILTGGGGSGGGQGGGGSAGQNSINPANQNSPQAGAPTITSIRRLANANIELVWQDNSSNEDHFEVEAAPNADSNVTWSLIGRPGQDVTQYIVSRDANYYRVVAVAPNGDRNASAPRANPGYTIGSGLGAPGRPTVSFPNPYAAPPPVRVTWQDNASNEDLYLIQGLRAGPSGEPGEWRTITPASPVSPDGQLGNFGNAVFDNTAGYTQVRVAAQGSENGQTVFAFSQAEPIPGPTGRRLNQGQAAAPSGLLYTVSSAPNQPRPDVILLWRDNSIDETGFEIELGTPLAGGGYSWRTATSANQNASQATLQFDSSFQTGSAVVIRVTAVGGGLRVSSTDPPLTITVP